MTSIQRFLTITIISTILVFQVVSFIIFQNYSKNRLNVLFDTHLVDEAHLVHQLINTHIQVKPGQQLDVQSTSTDLQAQNHLRVQVIQEGDAQTEDFVIFNSHEKFPIQKISGFRNFEFDDFEWRSFGLYQKSSKTWVIISDRIVDRTQSTDDFTTHRYLPVVFIRVMLLLGIIYFVINYSFKPLHRLTKALMLKKVSDLSPLKLDKIPKELVPLVDSVNGLLNRLNAAFQREKQFSADAAHELRNPLASIRVNMDNLLEEQKTPSVDAQRLDKGIQRMQHILVQMLTLHRVGTDPSAANFDVFDLKECASKVVTEVYDEIFKTQHNIEVEGLSSSLIQGEPHAIEVLIRNLLLNAVRYSPDGSQIVINIDENDSGNTCLSVIDSGPGIPKQEREKVFTRFYREGGDRHTSSVSGCGLGLSIVEKIVKLHAATIHIENSKFATGVSFVVTFPKRVVVNKKDQELVLESMRHNVI